MRRGMLSNSLYGIILAAVSTLAGISEGLCDPVVLTRPAMPEHVHATYPEPQIPVFVVGKQPTAHLRHRQHGHQHAVSVRTTETIVVVENKRQDQAILRYFKHANPNCDVIVKPVYRGKIAGIDQSVVVASSVTEGCGGGNLWSSGFSVFTENKGHVRELPVPEWPTGQVQKVAVRNNRIIVDWNRYRETDAHCCPSERHRTAYRIHDGKVVIIW